MEIELLTGHGPASLFQVELLCWLNSDEVLMVGQYQKQLIGALEPVLPLFHSQLDGQ